MYYIYCYTNKYNNKTYVGQTNNIARRMSEHRHDANTPSRDLYNTPFHKALRKFGEEHFLFDILEILDTLDLNLVDKLELYWIELKHSYKNENGYNLTYGGQNGLRGTNKYSKDLATIQALQDDLRYSNLTYKKLSQKYNIGESAIVDINKGRTHYREDLTYPLRNTKITDDKKLQIALLLTTTNLTREQIAKQTNVSLSTVKRIKAGTIKVSGYDNYPLLKPVSTIKG